MKTIHLFVPCLVEDFLPEVAQATAQVLQNIGLRVVCPKGQTCCGQPLYKSGRTDQARALALRFLDLFEDADAVVAPSGSCVTMVRKYVDLFADDSQARTRAVSMASRTFELCEYLTRQAGQTKLGASFTGRAAYHDSCQIGRALGLHDEPRALLDAVQGLERLELKAPGECCGFGGPFAVQHPALSESMLDDKLDDLLGTGADIAVTAEPSCLLNIRGGLKHRGAPMKAMHIAEILASREDS